MNTNVSEYKDNIKDIVSYTKSLKEALKGYEKKKEALDLLMYDIGSDNEKRIRADIQKWYGKWALNSIAQIENEIAELKKKFEGWK